MTSLHELYARYGQSPWIDNIRRDWLEDGTLRRMVDEGVRGVTSNPSIFAKALSTSTAYDEAIARTSGLSVEEVFEELAVQDVRDACDVLRALHDDSTVEFRRGVRHYCDGFVSLEVSPLLARDSDATVSAALRLAARVDRPNLLIKIPATIPGLSAITEVIAAGVSVNVTLIFSTQRYGEVIAAWSAGLARAAKEGRDLATIASVASFFVSRVDVAVDAMLAEGDVRRGLTANAQVAAAYELFKERMERENVQLLIRQGAQIQRPLWASTSTKNPQYDPLLYVNDLVAPDTVNTMPDATLAATLENPNFAASLLVDDHQLRETAARLSNLPPTLSLDAVTDQLEVDGVNAFAASYHELLATIAAKMAPSP